MASINVVNNNLFTRAFGGTRDVAVADKFVSGYGFIWFDILPTFIAEAENGLAPKLLSALCLSVSLPTIDLNKTTTRGIGGTKWSVPTDLAVGDTVSIRYIELSGTPITNIHEKWVNYIRDIRTGATNLDDYTKTNYSASLLYWTTKPDGETLEKAYYLTGLFPQRAPIDSQNFDVNTVDKVEIEITYNVDNIYIYSEDELVGNSFIKAKVDTLTNEITVFKDVVRVWSG